MMPKQEGAATQSIDNLSTVAPNQSNYFLNGKG